MDTELKGCVQVLAIATFFAVIYTVWGGFEITRSPIRIILPLWGFWFFCFVFDYALPKIFRHPVNKWVERGGILIALLFCLFVFYTCEKGIADNSIVYYNIHGKVYHADENCDKLDPEQDVLQSRKIVAEKKGLEHCFCCERDEYEE